MWAHSSCARLSGAAGLLLARAIIAPGAVRRATALRRVAPQALVIELGCMVMLGMAGLMEGFVSPSELASPARLAVLVVSLCGRGVYLTCAGLRRQGCNMDYIPEAGRWLVMPQMSCCSAAASSSVC